MFLRSCFLCLLICLCTSYSAWGISGSAPPPSDAAKQKALESKDSLFGRHIAKSGATLYRGTPGQPGKIFGEEDTKPSEEELKIFQWGWRYRPICYEMYYANLRDLARGVYGLALHTEDIDIKTNFSRFTNMVQCCHYSINQVCNWANEVFTGKFKNFSPEETILLGSLIQDGALRIENGKFVPIGLISYIIVAAPGKRQTLVQGLEHQRLHIFWRENEAFRTQVQKLWKNLSEKDSEVARKRLQPMFGDDENRMIEEWAVQEAEAGRLSPDQIEAL